MVEHLVLGGGDLGQHPRLYLGRRQVARLKEPAGQGFLRNAAAEVATQADEYALDSDFDELAPKHNTLLDRARRMQKRVVTLIVQWLRTAEPRYRDAALALIDTMGRWEYWSWAAWRQRDPRPEAVFDLSYGENSATLALAYDLLYHDMNEQERSAITAIASRRSLRPFLHIIKHGASVGSASWHQKPGSNWFRRPGSNWNAVCVGGAGMLALAMYEELDEAPAVLAKVEESIEPFMQTVDHTEGGWPEGIGYWNYGMRYAFMYLLSHEQATGRPHPLLQAEAIRKTLAFPLDFCPHGQPCSFGDANRWTPLPFHYAAAERLAESWLFRALDAAVEAGREGPDRLLLTGRWPVAAETLLLYPTDTPVDNTAETEDDDHGGGSRLYPVLGWVRLADRWPNPRLYLSIRGGSTEVPHNHLDLLSFHAVVGDERLIDNLSPAQYLDTTFGHRRFELFEMVPQSKNVPLINGVGITRPAHIEPTLLNYGPYPGVHLDATEAMGTAGDDQNLAAFCGRLFLLLGQQAALVIDRIDLNHNGRVETRLHTRAKVLTDQNRAYLTGQRHQLSLAFTANLPFTLSTTTTVPTTPGDEATMIRWCGPKELARHFLTATLLTPNRTNATIELESTHNNIIAHVQLDNKHQEITLTKTLKTTN